MRCRLDYMNLDTLEGQLARGEYLDDLARLDGTKYPHWDVLCSYLLSADPVARERWATCLFKLIELKAPANHGDMCVSGALTTFRWTPGAELSRRLAQMYLDAGYLAVDRPLAGQLPMNADARRSSSGRLPLAAAIGHDIPEAVRFLLDNGASLDIGPIFTGGPVREAVAYAQDLSVVASSSVLVEFVMRKCLSTAAASKPSDTVGPRGRRSSL